MPVEPAVWQNTLQKGALTLGPYCNGDYTLQNSALKLGPTVTETTLQNRALTLGPYCNGDYRALTETTQESMSVTKSRALDPLLRRAEHQGPPVTEGR